MKGQEGVKGLQWSSGLPTWVWNALHMVMPWTLMALAILPAYCGKVQLSWVAEFPLNSY